MDFNTLLGILGPDARQAVAEFYLNEDGVPTYGDGGQAPAAPNMGGRGGFLAPGAYQPKCLFG